MILEVETIGERLGIHVDGERTGFEGDIVFSLVDRGVGRRRWTVGEELELWPKFATSGVVFQAK
jgi:hypothetical protein